MRRIFFLLGLFVAVVRANPTPCEQSTDTITVDRPGNLELNQDCTFRVWVKPSKEITPGSGLVDTLKMTFKIQRHGTLKTMVQDGWFKLKGRPYTFESSYNVYQFSGTDTGLVIEADIIYQSTLPVRDYLLIWSDPTTTAVRRAPKVTKRWEGWSLWARNVLGRYVPAQAYK